jgi:hypothetical protein
MDFVDQVDMQPVHAVHPVHRLDSEENFLDTFSGGPPRRGVRRKWVPGHYEI